MAAASIFPAQAPPPSACAGRVRAPLEPPPAEALEEPLRAFQNFQRPEVPDVRRHGGSDQRPPDEGSCIFANDPLVWAVTREAATTLGPAFPPCGVDVKTLCGQMCDLATPQMAPAPPQLQVCLSRQRQKLGFGVARSGACAAWPASFWEVLCQTWWVPGAVDTCAAHAGTGGRLARPAGIRVQVNEVGVTSGVPSWSSYPN